MLIRVMYFYVVSVFVESVDVLNYLNLVIIMSEGLVECMQRDLTLSSVSGSSGFQRVPATSLLSPDRYTKKVPGQQRYRLSSSGFPKIVPGMGSHL